MKNITEEKKELIKNTIAFSIGGGSMCWNPRPEGVFDSEKAIEIVDATVLKILEILEEDNFSDTVLKPKYEALLK